MMCENYLNVIRCEGGIANFNCPDSMSVFIVDGFYGRKSRDV